MHVVLSSKEMDGWWGMEPWTTRGGAARSCMTCWHACVCVSGGEGALGLVYTEGKTVLWVVLLLWGG